MENVSCALLQLCAEDDLYCKPCNQYFNNLHNKREHIFGRKHKQTVSGRLNESEEEEELPGFNAPVFTEEFLKHNESMWYKMPFPTAAGRWSALKLNPLKRYKTHKRKTGSPQWERYMADCPNSPNPQSPSPNPTPGCTMGTPRVEGHAESALRLCPNLKCSIGRSVH